MAEAIPKKKYAFVWAALMILLFATWGLSRLDLKPFGMAIALTISVLKTILIVLYFMHLRYSSRLVWVAAATGLVWLIIFVDLTMSDYLTRGYSWSQ
jgi:cytochrome c oxidase subunit 4